MAHVLRPRSATALVATLVAVLACYFTVPVSSEQAPLRLVLNLAVTVLSVGAIVVLVVREVGAELRGDGRRLRGTHLLMILELILLAFALAYYMLSIRGTHQMAGIHTRLDALYFTASTMTTVGYGDIHPVGQLARAVTVLHLGVNVVFLAAVAQLVNARLGRRPHDDTR